MKEMEKEKREERREKREERREKREEVNWVGGRKIVGRVRGREKSRGIGREFGCKV